MRPYLADSNTLKFFIIGSAGVIIIAGMRAASDILVPFLLSVIIAVIATPPLQWLQYKHLPRWLAVCVVILAIASSGVAIIALMGTSINDFTQSLPTYKASLKREIDAFSRMLADHGITTPTEVLKRYLDPGAAMDIVSKLFSSLGNVLTDAFFILLTVTFILAETSGFSDKLHTAFDDANNHIRRFEYFMQTVKRYIAIKTATSMITGVIIACGLWLLNIDYPLLWGLLAFLLNYVPTIGSIIAAVPAVLLAFIQHGSVIAMLSASGYLVVNIVIGSVIEPRFMGRGLGLSTLVVFLSLIFWGWMFGPIGMLLSVPLTMFVKIALENSEDTRWLAVLMAADAPKDDRVPPSPASTEQGHR